MLKLISKIGKAVVARKFITKHVSLEDYKSRIANNLLVHFGLVGAKAALPATDAVTVTSELHPFVESEWIKWSDRDV